MTKSICRPRSERRSPVPARIQPGAWVALTFVVLSLARCGQTEELPEAKPLLERASRAMTGIESVRFNLDVDGTTSGLMIRSAEGVITRQGEVSAGAQVLQAGRLVEYEYVLADGTAYLKGPTGGFQSLPEQFAARIYNPSKLLDETSGLQRSLAAATDARTEALETIDGSAAYRVRARVTAEPVQGLSGLPAGQRLDATLWIDRDSGRLVQARVPFSTSGSDEQAVLRIKLSNFNEPVDIKPPLP